jgi:hypothetical protein
VVTITKVAQLPGPPYIVNVGDEIPYRITVTNTTRCPVPAGIRVIDFIQREALPGEPPPDTLVTYIGGSQFGANIPPSDPLIPVLLSLTWDLDEIPPFGSVELGYSMRAERVGNWVNRAQIQTGTGTGQSSSVDVTIQN